MPVKGGGAYTKLLGGLNGLQESPELRCTACGERMPTNHHELAHLLRKGAALHVQGHHQYRSANGPGPMLSNRCRVVYSAQTLRILLKYITAFVQCLV